MTTPAPAQAPASGPPASMPPAAAPAGAPAEARGPMPHEGFGARLGDLFHRAEADLPVIEDDAKALLRGHSAALIRAAADLLEDHPGTEKTAGVVLEVALGIAKVAGIAL